MNVKYRIEASFVSNGGWFLVSHTNVYSAAQRMLSEAEARFPYVRIS